MQVAFRNDAQGFSLVEILIGIALSTVLFTAAALVYQTVSHGSNPRGSLEKLTFEEGVLENFYSLASNTHTVYAAPNAARTSFAKRVGQRLIDDMGSASAVYVLGRNGLNDYRPTSIPYPPGSPLLDSPNRFLAHISAQAPDETEQFVAYESVSDQDSHSIYLLQPSTTSEDLNVLSIYDFDVVALPNQGDYVSVRRYVEGDLTAYYDIFFPEASGSPFRPNVVHFPRKGLAPYLDPTPSRFAVSEEMPFYMIWWPDPAARSLDSPTDPPTPSVPANSPVLDYYQMGGRTSLQFVLPAFPALR